MSETARPRLREDLVLRKVEHELVVYDPLADRICLLNHSATAVLELCDGMRTRAEVASAIRTAYALDAETARGEVERVLAELAGHGLMRDQEPPLRA